MKPQSKDSLIEKVKLKNPCSLKIPFLFSVKSLFKSVLIEKYSTFYS